MYLMSKINFSSCNTHYKHTHTQKKMTQRKIYTMQKKKWWIKGEKIFLASPLMKCKLFQRNLENWM